MLFTKGIGWYDGMTIYKIIFVGASGCILLKLILSKHTIKEWCFIIVALSFGIINMIIAGDKGILIYILLILGIKNVSVNRMIKVGTVIWIGCFGGNFLFFVMQQCKGMALVHEKMGFNAIIRWGMGYSHPNVFHISYAICALFMILLFRWSKKNVIKVSGILFAGNILIFLYSLSYTGFLLTSFILAAFIYFAFREKRTKIEDLLIQAILPACLLYAIGLPLIFREGVVSDSCRTFVNNLTNSRLIASQVYLEKGVTLFGKNLADFNTAMALDSSYLFLLISGGTILFVLIMFIYLKAIRSFLVNDEKKALQATLPILVAGTFEPFLFNTSFKNLSFIFIGQYIWEILKGKNEKKEVGITNVGEQKILKFPAVHKRIIYNVKAVILLKWKKILIFSCLMGVLVMFSASSFYKENRYVYITQSKTDCAPREVFYLDSKNIDDTLVLEWEGPDIPMYRFDGDILQVEKFRFWIGSYVCGFVGSFIVLGCFYIGRRKVQYEKNY